MFLRVDRPSLMQAMPCLVGLTILAISSVHAAVPECPQHTGNGTCHPAAPSSAKAPSVLQHRSRQARTYMRSDDAASLRAPTALETEAELLQEELLALVDAPIANLAGDSLGTATQKWLQQQVIPAAAKRREDCDECNIPNVRDLMSASWPSNKAVHELCTCGGEFATSVIAHVATGLSAPWSCADRCFDVAPRVKPEWPTSLMATSTGSSKKKANRQIEVKQGKGNKAAKAARKAAAKAAKEEAARIAAEEEAKAAEEEAARIAAEEEAKAAEEEAARIAAEEEAKAAEEEAARLAAEEEAKEAEEESARVAAEEEAARAEAARIAAEEEAARAAAEAEEAARAAAAKATEEEAMAPVRVYVGKCSRNEKSWTGSSATAQECESRILARGDCNHRYFFYAASDLGGDSNCGCIDPGTDCSENSRQPYWNGKVGLYAVGQTSTGTGTTGPDFSESFMGCFSDNGNRAFSGASPKMGYGPHTVADCWKHCQGKKYMAVQDGDQCFCGDTYKQEGYPKVSDSECSKNGECSVPHGCGGSWRNSIYKIDELGAPGAPEAPVIFENQVEENAAGVGGWGGWCKCPDGEMYGVGDNNDACGSLACIGGEAGTCNRGSGKWSHRKVTCAGAGAGKAATSNRKAHLEDNLGPFAQAAPAPECSGENFVGSNSVTLPDHCWGYVLGSGSDSWKELPPGSYSEQDLIHRGIFNPSECGAKCTVLDMQTVSNRPPDCAEEVLLRLLMVEYLEPGVDDTLMTAEQKFLFGNVTRYGSIAKFRAAKTAPTMVRFLFHDAGDFDNTETVSGEEVPIGHTGTDGCLHTFRDHRGDKDSWRAKGEGSFWEQPVDAEFDEGTNLGHNKNLVTDVFEAFLRLHSVNDLGTPEFGKPLKARASHFWDKLDQSVLPRLTRPDAVTLGANAAMEAMFGFGEPLEMKYGRWYGQDCAGRRDEAEFPNRNRRRRFRTNDGRSAEAMRKMTDTGDRVAGIEPFGKYRTVIKEPFALHDEHKKSWCPVASTLPAVKNKMQLSDAESVALFGAHSIARIERPSKTPCSYMSNMFFCPQMCPRISESAGVRYNNGFVFDDSPDLLDNRYFANMMDSDFEALPHCVALGASGHGGPGVPKRSPGPMGTTPEHDQGIVRLGVMGLGCQPVPWAPVVDSKQTRPCVAGYKISWADQSQCEVDTCIDKCITESKRCTHVWDDPSKDCRRCKFECDDFFNHSLPKDLPYFLDPYSAENINKPMKERFGRPANLGPDRRAPLGSENWAPTLRHYDGNQPMAKVEELRQFRWCKYTDSYEGNPLLGQGKNHAGGGVDYPKNWLVWAPGPVDPNFREWGGPGTVMNMEQFAFLHGNPTPIFMMSVDWSLLGQESSKKWVKAFGGDNALFEKNFASAWKKVTSAGWDAPEMPKSGWAGSKLENCKKSKCTAKDGRFWCPVDMVNDRLKYLPKPVSLRLVLGECTGGSPPNSASNCELVGGFGVRGTVQCSDKTYHCCSERACQWEKWLVEHRKADMSEEATCPFTPQDKEAEVARTIETWRGGADKNGPACPPGEKKEWCGATTPADLGMDYTALQTENIERLFAHKREATVWFESHRQNGTLPKEMSCDWGGQACYRWGNDPKFALEFLSVPTGEKNGAGVVEEGLIHKEMLYEEFENSPGIYGPI
eukprot:TRINITY_DN977_c0_g1_i3.p1 TRINITY_DN977_c0_g1~~TRINITY_DN977_c0_g1_i3.p1  ORF type:complete len:1652 (+),score=356.20 TRINITY_DN977_c0_g1_i3:28-4983(+)